MVVLVKPPVILVVCLQPPVLVLANKAILQPPVLVLVKPPVVPKVQPQVPVPAVVVVPKVQLHQARGREALFRW